MFDLTLASIPFVGAKTLIQQAINTLRQIDGAHVYLPGEGSVFGLRAGNYIDSAGTLAGVLDSPVGRVEDVFGGIHASQNTTADKPVLKLTNDRYHWLFDTTDTLALTLPAGYESATVIDATSAGPVTLLEQDVTGAYGIVGGLTNSGELVTNGNNLADTAGWTPFNANLSVASGALVVTSTGGQHGAYTSIATVVGRMYTYTIKTISDNTTGDLTVRIGTSNTGTQLGLIQADNLTTSALSFVATRDLIYISVISTSTALADETFSLRNISVKEILPSTHGRIILRDTPTARQLELCQHLASRLAGL
jgi:hypothetical protein